MRKKTIDMIPVLSDDVKFILTSFSKGRSFPASLVKRSRIIFLASQGMSNQTIASQVDLHYNRVAAWRNRFMEALPSLREIEAGAPPVFTQEQIMAIIAPARRNPCGLGYEVSQWSLPLLTMEIKKQGIADRISEKSVSRFLKMR